MTLKGVIAKNRRNNVRLKIGSNVIIVDKFCKKPTYKYRGF